MAAILKIDNLGHIVEVMPPEEGIIELWVGTEEESKPCICVALDRKDAKKLISFLQDHLEELK